MPTFCAILAFIIVLDSVIIPNAKYNNAIALMNTGNVVDAYETLIALDGYKDSTDKANSIYGKYKIEKLKVVKTGDYIFFGAYEQDNDTSNGKEAIEWLVLEKENDKILLISKYALDCQQYNTSWDTVTWETCTLRKWLNGTFINAAFSTEEKALILNANVSADKNPSYSTDPGNATTDKVFLLSINEAKKYFTSDAERKCAPTDYAKAQGTSTSSSCTVGGKATCWCWLRSPGSSQISAAYVYSYGGLDECGDLVDRDNRAVRPALWITLGS